MKNKTFKLLYSESIRIEFYNYLNRIFNTFFFFRKKETIIWVFI